MRLPPKAPIQAIQPDGQSVGQTQLLRSKFRVPELTAARPLGQATSLLHASVCSPVKWE